MTQLPPRRLAWLRGEVDAWQAEGLVDERAAAAIRSRYTADTRASLASLVLGIGSLFVGVGVLWLVATNYEDLSPLVRFLLVAAFWLGTTIAGTATSRFGGPLRLLGALLFGAVVFQAAQSLQVPAYEPVLLLAWAGGALALAYATRSTGPLAVGIAAGVGWYLFHLVGDSESVGAFVLGTALAVPVLVACGAVDPDGRFADAWTRAACLLGLLALFVSAFPGALDPVTPARPFYAGVTVAILATVAGLWRTAGRRLPELGGGLAVAGVATTVVLATPDGDTSVFGESLSGAALAWALLASAAFLVAAVAVAALGVAREMPGLVNLASAALVVFVTLQSFGLFSSLLSGAGLFLAIGVLLVGTGLLVDRGRRRLREEITT